MLYNTTVVRHKRRSIGKVDSIGEIPILLLLLPSPEQSSSWGYNFKIFCLTFCEGICILQWPDPRSKYYYFSNQSFLAGSVHGREAERWMLNVPRRRCWVWPGPRRRRRRRRSSRGWAGSPAPPTATGTSSGPAGRSRPPRRASCSGSITMTERNGVGYLGL